MTAAHRRRRLVDDVDRVQRYMAAVLTDARRVGAPIPEAVAVSVHVWRAWSDRLRDWADTTT